MESVSDIHLLQSEKIDMATQVYCSSILNICPFLCLGNAAPGLQFASIKSNYFLQRKDSKL